MRTDDQGRFALSELEPDGFYRVVIRGGGVKTTESAWFDASKEKASDLPDLRRDPAQGGDGRRARPRGETAGRRRGPGDRRRATCPDHNRLAGTIHGRGSVGQAVLRRAAPSRFPRRRPVLRQGARDAGSDADATGRAGREAPIRRTAVARGTGEAAGTANAAAEAKHREGARHARIAGGPPSAGAGRRGLRAGDTSKSKRP